MAVKSVEVIINGITTVLNYNNGTNAWERDIVAPGNSSFNNNAGHYYPVVIKATDDAGNVTVIDDTDAEFGNLLHLIVKETVPPIISITYPTDSQILVNSNPVITWTVTDNDSGVSLSNIEITIDGGEKITQGIIKTPITGGLSCSYAVKDALSDGSHIIKVDAQDNDENKAVQRSVSFTIDTIPPLLSVVSPTNNLITNIKNISVSGVTNDATSGPCKVTVSLNGATPINVNVGENGAFSVLVTLIEGTNTILVVSTDLAGKHSEVLRTVILDTVAPAVNNVSIQPNPVGTSDPVKVLVRVTD